MCPRLPSNPKLRLLTRLSDPLTFRFLPPVFRPRPYRLLCRFAAYPRRRKTHPFSDLMYPVHDTALSNRPLTDRLHRPDPLFFHLNLTNRSPRTPKALTHWQWPSSSYPMRNSLRLPSLPHNPVWKCLPKNHFLLFSGFLLIPAAQRRLQYWRLRLKSPCRFPPPHW